MLLHTEGQDLQIDCWPQLSAEIEDHPVTLGMTCIQHIEFSGPCGLSIPELLLPS